MKIYAKFASKRNSIHKLLENELRLFTWPGSINLIKTACASESTNLRRFLTVYIT